jgi:NAD(P)-dependent dehydrogenase (short-subunit alcohol dehydrogenase family)
MDVRLDDRVALITGGSRGIGLAIAQEYARSGARVMISSRKADVLEAAVATIDGDAAWFAANAGDPAEADACVAATMERFGRVDVLVNNAATNPYMGKTIDIDRPRLDKTISVNWAGPLMWSQLVWQAWMREHGGSVLNIASIGGLSVETSIGAYNATKAALLHLTRTLAAEMAPGVRVNAIAPGLVKTDMARALWEQHEAAMAKGMPLQRLGEPEDIARAATFLSSDLASWITGTTVVVDGGALLHA